MSMLHAWMIAQRDLVPKAWLAGLIVEDKASSNSPSWLEPLARDSVAHRESLRVSTKETYDQKVNRRFAAISDLVVRLEEILSSDNPDAVINGHAKASTVNIITDSPPRTGRLK